MLNENDLANIKVALKENINDCKKLGLNSMADDYQETLDKVLKIIDQMKREHLYEWG